MEHKNKEKLDWIIASNIDKGINLQTVYGTYLEIRELLQKKINECRIIKMRFLNFRIKKFRLLLSLKHTISFLQQKSLQTYRTQSHGLLIF